jgi:Concanavalin A-like lectin/glucanases superfamily
MRGATFFLALAVLLLSATECVAQVIPAAFWAQGNSGLASGIQFYWKLDEGSGTSVVDAMGANTGTWQGTLGSQWTTGKISGGGNFNGTDGYVSTVSGTGFAAGAPFSIAAWVNLAAGGGAFPMIFDTSLSGSSSVLFAGVNIGSNSSAGFNMYINGIQTSNNTVFTKGVWHHVVGTYDGVNMKVYVDGAHMSSTAGSTPAISGSNLYIGNGTAYANSMWKGQIDEVAVWNRALSAGEIATLYNSGSGDPFLNSANGFAY